MGMKQFQVIRDFEQALAEYTGAPYVTCVNSCTMALRLCLDWYYRNDIGCRNIIIPKHTYISVPIQIKRAGFEVEFSDMEWKGAYNLGNTNIFDAARRFHANMYTPGKYICVSFHYTKILNINHGGAILHDNTNAIHFFESMRHDGRLDGMPIDNEYIRYLGHHCPISVETAAQGLVKLASLPSYNDDLPNSSYPDLSQLSVFK